MVFNLFIIFYLFNIFYNLINFYFLFLFEINFDKILFFLPILILFILKDFDLLFDIYD